MEVRSGEIIFFGITTEDKNSGMAFARKELPEKIIELPAIHIDIVETKDWIEKIKLCKAEHKGLLETQIMEDGRKFVIVGLKNAVDLTYASLNDMVQSKTTSYEELNIEEHHSRLLHMAFETEIKNLEKSVTDGILEINFLRHGKRIRVTANTQDMQMAKKEIDKMVRSIKSSDMAITDPAMSEFLSQNPGKDSITLTENHYKVVILPVSSKRSPWARSLTPPTRYSTIFQK